MGCGVGSEAFGSPMFAQTIIPPLMTIFGFAPKNAGSQSTRSAILPGLDRAEHVGDAGGDGGIDRDLGDDSEARGSCRCPRSPPAERPRALFMQSAVWMARSQFSPTRPIACESLPMIEMTPMSWSTFSAAIVSARTRLSANATSDGTFGIEVVTDHDHVEELGLRVDAVGQRRVGRAREHVELAGDLQDVGGVAAARALAVVRVDRASLEGRDRVFDEARLVQRVGVDRHLDVVLVGDVAAPLGSRPGWCPSPRGS